MRPTCIFMTGVLLCTASLAQSPEEEATIGRKLEGLSEASTFIELLKNTDNAEALLFAPRGSTTVFVPTNEAFARMDEGKRAKLFDPNNKRWLERVLTYHAVHGATVDAYTVQNVGFLKNGLGQYLTLDTDAEGTRTVDGARILRTDLGCSNGIVHFIDTVLDPVELDLFEHLESDGRFEVLTKLIKRSGLTKVFQNRHNVFTVFAPTDEAFASLPAGTTDSLLSPEKLDLLSDVIRSHIVSGVQTVAKTIDLQPLGTPGNDIRNQYGQELIFRLEEGRPTIDGRKITSIDQVARNGIIHVIDAPLMPKRQSITDKLEEVGHFEVFLDLCKLGGAYDLLSQFNEQITVFAPVDATFEAPEAALALQALRRPEQADRLRGILERHIVRGTRFTTTNAIAYRRLDSTLRARLDIVRNGDDRRVQGVPILHTDLLARNGVAHGIQGLIPEGLDLPDEDQSWFTYRSYVVETLAAARKMYGAGALRETTDYLARRNYEFIARYSADLRRFYDIDARKTLNRDQSRNRHYDFASTAWRQRNGFRELLRQLEQRRPVFIDEIELRRRNMGTMAPALGSNN